ncbi:helix-turn-helix transcriptional regulator [Azotosporobacter soli]|uniref:helix-turn-helix transcriptional regulator n=1 Tax=Azotosporobacter soli TaxID=3055040 RepID=UPI003D160862
MTKSTMQLRIGNCLNVFRAKRKLTQEQLAKEIGVTRATIISIEGGGYNPSLELAFRIARYFQADINEIFSVEEDENETL